MPESITFEQLKQPMRERAGLEGWPTPTSVSNVISALNGFLEVLGLSNRAVVGKTLRDGFDAALELYSDRMKDSGADLNHLKNRKSALRHWNRLMRTLDHEAALTSIGGTTPFSRRFKQLVESVPYKERSRFFAQAGIAPTTRQFWARGTTPRHDSYAAILRIEKLFNLVPTSLLNLLGFNARWEKAKSAIGEEAPSAILYRRQQSERHWSKLDEDVPLLMLSKDEWTERLRAEWRGLLAYKTGLDDAAAKVGSKLGALRSAMAGNGGSARKRWRLRPIEDYPATHPSWVIQIGNFRVPSAGINHHAFSCFLGWCRLPVENYGGAGLPVESLSLSSMLNRDLITGYLEWRTTRAGAPNQQLKYLLAQIGMLVHPETGYLTKNFATFGPPVGINDPDGWAVECVRAKKWVDLQSKNIAHLLELTRDPVEPIRFALKLPEPLQPFIDAVNRMKNCNRAKPIDRATIVRDRLLIGLTLSNPLRAENLMLLTYKPDNTGSFQRTPDGGWKLFIPSEHFKNFRGAAREDYCLDIDPALWQILEDYLRDFRPLIAPMERGLVFVARGEKERLWENLGERFRAATKEFVIGCEGVGTHAMRYLVGTSVIVRSQGDYVLAAKFLHDLPETVRKHYVKLLDEYTNRGKSRILGPVLAGLAA